MHDTNPGSTLLEALRSGHLDSIYSDTAPRSTLTWRLLGVVILIAASVTAGFGVVLKDAMLMIFAVALLFAGLLAYRKHDSRHRLPIASQALSQPVPIEPISPSDLPPPMPSGVPLDDDALELQDDFSFGGANGKPA